MATGETKIFVGVRDSREMKRLGAERKAQGWTVGANFRGPPIDKLLKPGQLENKIVTVEGATAADCVSSIIIETLSCKTLEVRVPLENIRALRKPDNLPHRAAIIHRALLRFDVNVNDPRLKVTPVDVWESIKKTNANDGCPWG